MMEEALEILIYVVTTAVAGALGTWGTMALNAVRKQAKLHASATFINMLEKAIASGAKRAKENGLDQHAAGWLTEVLSYTKQSIPDAIAQQKVTSDQIVKKIEAMKPDLETMLATAAAGAAADFMRSRR